MKTETEIRAKIKEIEESYKHILCGSLATIQINAPRALMQIEAKAKLSALYFVLGEKCPIYEFESKVHRVNA